jgi:hypothetical protein
MFADLEEVRAEAESKARSLSKGELGTEIRQSKPISADVRLAFLGEHFPWADTSTQD